MIEREFGTRPGLERGSGGVFDVTVDGRLLFSKHDEGDEFPDPAEIVRRMKALG